MNANHLLIDRRDGLGVITFNRSEARNAMNPEMRDSLLQALDQFDNDQSIAAVLLQGRGGSFIAGGDMQSFSQALALTADERRENFRDRVNVSSQLVNRLVNFPKPLIAVIEGDVAGAGISVALCCDFVLATQDSRFTFAHAHVGLAMDLGLRAPLKMRFFCGSIVGDVLASSCMAYTLRCCVRRRLTTTEKSLFLEAPLSYFLPRLVGTLQARRLAMLGERISADEAFQLGLLTSVVDAEEMSNYLETLVSRLAKMPATALTGIKQELVNSAGSSLQDQLSFESDRVADCAATDTFEQCVKAFVNRC